MRTRWLALILWAWTCAAVVPPARAQSPTPPPNDDCLACHGDPSTTRADGRSVAVAPESFAKSVHGTLDMACVDCHADLAKTTEFPHPDRLAPVNCATCHEDAVKAFDASVHAAARQGSGSTGATCVDCHGMHDILPKSDPQSRTYHLNVAATCERCHTASAGKGAKPVGSAFEDSIHGQALKRAGLLVAPNCASCHGAHEIRTKDDPKSRVFRTTVIGTCTACHAGIKPQYDSSVHGQAAAAGNKMAPVCSDCHTAHSITAVDADRWQLAIIRECGTCHEQSLRTYRDTFHGKVTELGFTRVAKCSDCHGAHGILPASNPQSLISPERRLTTCQKCHAGANENFAQYDPHADPHDRERNPVLHGMSIFMQVLLAGVFTFFGMHTLLWFPRSWQARRARRHRDEPPPDANPPADAAAGEE